MREDLYVKLGVDNDLPNKPRGVVVRFGLFLYPFLSVSVFFLSNLIQLETEYAMYNMSTYFCLV